MRVQAWWNTRDHLPRVPKGLSAQVDEFRALFLDACKLRLQGEGSLRAECSDSAPLRQNWQLEADGDTKFGMTSVAAPKFIS
jgi:hypothetical protein